MFHSNTIRKNRSPAIIKPNLQPIKTEPCQAYCLDQPEITPDSSLITCDLVIKRIMPSFPCKI